MTAYTKMDDYQLPDGKHIDWNAYNQAQKQNGERCFKCGKYLIFASGRLDECEDCKVLRRSKYAISHSTFVRCPHCKHEINVHENELYELYSEGYHEISCTVCDKSFEVETRVTYSFESPDIIECEEEDNDTGSEDDEERDSTA